MSCLWNPVRDAANYGRCKESSFSEIQHFFRLHRSASLQGLDRNHQIHLKNHRSVRVRIVNPAPGRGLFTSMAAARSHVERGHAVFTGELQIRFLGDAEILMGRQINREMERDRQYWRDVARQRGGEDVAFEWRATVGANGVTGMEGRPVAR